MKNSNQGHRERLREKFLDNGLSGFHDYEIVELLLTMATPRKDCKIAAKEAVIKHGSLRGVMTADDKELQKIKGIGEKNIFGIKFVMAVAEKFLKQNLIKKEICKSSKKVYDYLFFTMRDLKKEVFKVIFLDKKNAVIEVENLFEGTVDKSAIYPREIVKKAIEHNASGIIIVHNHPSGNIQPSPEDEKITQQLLKATNMLQIRMLDHIIIGDNKYYSFADTGEIEIWNE